MGVPIHHTRRILPTHRILLIRLSRSLGLLRGLCPSRALNLVRSLALSRGHVPRPAPCLAPNQDLRRDHPRVPRQDHPQAHRLAQHPDQDRDRLPILIPSLRRRFLPAVDRAAAAEVRGQLSVL